jgi:hypothetical protein
LTPYLPEYLSASVNHLQAFLPTFTKYYITDSISVPASSEGEPIEIPKFAAPLIDFVACAARGGRAMDWFRTNMAALVEVTLSWSQMTRDNVRRVLRLLVVRVADKSAGRGVGVGREPVRFAGRRHDTELQCARGSI